MSVRTAFVTLALFASTPAFALSTGDIAFIGYNADGDDDFAIVVLTDLMNETIFFTDNETDGAGDLTTGEGVIQWDSGPVTAGTVIVFSDLSTPARSVTSGTITNPDGSLNLAAGGDSVLAYQGPDFSSTPVVFLAGMESGTGNAGSLDFTGLVDGSTFVSFSNGANDDGGYYDGPRQTSGGFSSLLNTINNASQWVTDTSDGESLLPFDTTAFEANVATPTTVPVLGPIGLAMLGAGLAGAGASMVGRKEEDEDEA